METVALILHSKKRNIKIVTVMATSEIVTPIFPIICNDKVFCGERLRGRALSKMAK